MGNVIIYEFKSNSEKFSLRVWTKEICFGMVLNGKQHIFAFHS